jgi:uncharacterized membrane protein (GlpM family)
MLWVARFVVAGTAVTLSALLSKRFGGAAGGMVLAFPFVIGTGLLFTILEGGDEFRATASGVLWGLLPLLCFALVVLAVSRTHSGTVALTAGILTWIAAAAAIHWLR